MSYSYAFISSGIVLLIAFGLSLLTGLPNEVGDHGAKVIVLGAVYGAAVFSFMLVLARYVSSFTQQFREIIRMLNQLFGHFSWLMIILISIMAGVSEELLFRGVIQSYLTEVISPWFGVITTSLLFALLHFYNRLYLIVTFFFSLMIGYLYYASESLALVMVLHTIYDFFAFATVIKYPRLLKSVVK